MKLDFDPRKNITIIDHIIMTLKRIIKFNDIMDLLTIKKSVKNWRMVALFKLGIINGFKLILRDGASIKIDRSNFVSFWSYAPLMNELVLKLEVEGAHKIKNLEIDKITKIIKFEFKGNTVKFSYDSSKQLINTFGLIKEQFTEEQYKWLEVERKDVIDIGANVGDSAIYFALKGAKHVYAFEPYPYSYGIAMQNIKLNKLQDKITLLNEGCSWKEGKIKINAEYKNLGGTDLKNFKKGTNISITTLKEILKRFEIPEEAVLKIDCEGCEYRVLLETKNSDLRRFKQIQIEYHYGYLNIKKKLEGAGFRVTNTMPVHSANSEAENKQMIVGLIYASKT